MRYQEPSREVATDYLKVIKTNGMQVLHRVFAKYEIHLVPFAVNDTNNASCQLRTHRTEIYSYYANLCI